MSQEVFIFLTGGFAAFFIGLLGVAYNNPKFYLEYADMRLTFLFTLIGTFFSASLGTIYAVRSILLNVKEVPPNMIEAIDKGLSPLTEYVLYFFFASLVIIIGSILFSSVAHAVKKHQDRNS